MSDEQPEQPKRRGGWPKGKPRGPRKPKERETVKIPQPTQVPNPGQPTSTYTEPVQVHGTLSSGVHFGFRCAAFSRENGSYLFVSYPEMRGFKTITVVKMADISSITVTGPEQTLEVLRQQPPPAHAHVPPMPPPASAPVIYGNPLAAAIRAENAGERIVNPAIPILPMSKTVDGDTGRETVVGATMMGAPVTPK